jgi:hypothetical protein
MIIGHRLTQTDTDISVPRPRDIAPFGPSSWPRAGHACGTERVITLAREKHSHMESPEG